MIRDPQTPPGGSRQSEPPRNLDEALAALQAEREKRERAEAERDDWHSLATRLRTALAQSNADALTAERRLDEAVKLMSTDDDPSTERLLARIRQLEEALRPFAALAEDIDRLGHLDGSSCPHRLYARDIRKARAALNPDPPNPGTSDGQDTFD